MRSSRFHVVTVSLFCGFTAAAQQPPASRAPGPTELARMQQIVFREALRRVAPCIVRIDTVGGALPVAGPDDGPLAPAPPTAGGFRPADGPTTGVIWSDDGWIVTSSFNFIRDPAVITVRLHDGRRFVARLVARDHPARIAVLKIDANALPTPPRAAGDALHPGQWALAAGFGHGSDEPALSLGVVSAVQRMRGLALQIDAKTSPANYGGPVFDIEGRVLGVVVPMGGGDDLVAGVEWYDSGVGFAVHADRVDERLPQLREGRDVHAGVIGVSLVPDPVVGEPPRPLVLDEIPPARQSEPPARPARDDEPASQPAPTDEPTSRPAPTDTLTSQPAPHNDSVRRHARNELRSSPRWPSREDSNGGVRVLEVAPDGPAAAAGIQPGDLITHVDDVATPKRIAFQRRLARRAAGETVTLRYERSGETREAVVQLVPRESLETRRPTTRPAESGATTQPAEPPPGDSSGSGQRRHADGQEASDEKDEDETQSRTDHRQAA